MMRNGDILAEHQSNKLKFYKKKNEIMSPALYHCIKNKQLMQKDLVLTYKTPWTYKIWTSVSLIDCSCTMTFYTTIFLVFNRNVHNKQSF